MLQYMKLGRRAHCFQGGFLWLLSLQGNPLRNVNLRHDCFDSNPSVLITDPQTQFGTVLSHQLNHMQAAKCIFLANILTRALFVMPQCWCHYYSAICWQVDVLFVNLALKWDDDIAYSATSIILIKAVECSNHGVVRIIWFQSDKLDFIAKLFIQKIMDIGTF
jgi:hypothetical protein